MQISKITKYYNKIYDGMWKCVGTFRAGTNNKYLLKNIYNNKTLSVSAKTMAKIENGESTVSKTLHHLIKKNAFKVNKED